jgi:hypothetical protein
MSRRVESIPTLLEMDEYVMLVALPFGPFCFSGSPVLLYQPITQNDLLSTFVEQLIKSRADFD